VIKARGSRPEADAQLPERQIAIELHGSRGFQVRPRPVRASRNRKRDQGLPTMAKRIPFFTSGSERAMRPCKSSLSMREAPHRRRLPQTYGGEREEKSMAHF
jgi:hypothetical protein